MSGSGTAGPPVQIKTGMAQLCNQQIGIFELKQAGCSGEGKCSYARSSREHRRRA